MLNVWPFLSRKRPTCVSLAAIYGTHLNKNTPSDWSAHTGTPSAGQ